MDLIHSEAGILTTSALPGGGFSFYRAPMIDSFLDNLWLIILAIFSTAGQFVFSLTSLLHPFGPTVTITVFSFMVVALIKLLDKVIITKRYTRLEEEFFHWKSIRDETGNWDDRETGSRMARNIDQAELNRIYYDYFFEGVLLGIARRVFPMLLGFGFINEFYNPLRMEALFGRTFLFALPSTTGESFLVGAVFWYIISVILSLLLWFFIARQVKRRKTR